METSASKIWFMVAIRTIPLKVAGQAWRSAWLHLINYENLTGAKLPVYVAFLKLHVPFGCCEMSNIFATLFIINIYVLPSALEEKLIV